MKYLRDLYLDQGSQRRYRIILRELANRKPAFSQYILLLREYRLEIYSAQSLVRNWEYLSEAKIIGLAQGKDKAISLVRDIVEEFGLEYPEKLDLMETME